MLPLFQLALAEQLRIWRFGAALALFCIIVLLGSVPGARAEIAHLAPGVVLHTLAYACITFLLYTGTSGGRRQRAFKAVLTVLAMGAIDELVQSFFPYRHAAVLDWMVDGSAAIVTTALLWALLPEPLQAARAQ